MYDLENWFKQRIVRGLKRRRAWRVLGKESQAYRDGLVEETGLIRDAIKELRKIRSENEQRLLQTDHS